jgi:hypothetical protein
VTHTDDRPPPLDEPPWDPPEDPGPTPAPTDRNGTQPVPHDRAAEQIVLGAAMIDTAHLTACTKLVTGSDFWFPHHETIWRTLTALHNSEQPTSSVAVLAHLLETGDLTKIGGGAYLHTLESAAASVVDATWYARRIDKLARRRHAISYFQRGLQRLTAPGPDADVDQVLNDTTQALVEARDNLANPILTTTWSPVDLEPVLAGEHLDPPPTMLRRTDGIPLLYDGAIHTVSGETESGKTWLCLLAALQLMETGRSVVFLDFEDRADRVIGRLLALGATFPQLREHFDYVRPDRPLDDHGRAQLAPAVTGTDLVILDGVTEAMTMHGFDLNSNADSATFQGLLPRWIADHGPAVVMIDHVVKDKEKQDRFALGAQHKLAGIDGAAYIVKPIQPFGRGKRGLARVEVAKDRPGHVREHTFGKTIAEFSLDATGSDVVLTAHLTPPGADSGRPGQPFEPTHLMEKISRYVQANPGLSKKAIEDVMNGKASTKRLALELLVTRGHILAKPEARGRISHTSVKPYFRPDEDGNDEVSEHLEHLADGTLGPDPDPTQEAS